MWKWVLLVSVASCKTTPRDPIVVKEAVRTEIRKYANEAYPSWKQTRSADACPKSLDELNEYMNNRDHDDAWGHPLQMRCADGKMTVWSSGPDGIDGNADDVRADDPQ